MIKRFKLFVIDMIGIDVIKEYLSLKGYSECILETAEGDKKYTHKGLFIIEEKQL